MIVQAMNSDKSKSLKYKMFTPSGYKYIEIRKACGKNSIPLWMWLKYAY